MGMSNERVERFATLAELSAAHIALLKWELDGQAAGHSDFYTEVNSFLSKGQATGAVLDGDQERRAAQNLLNYWATVLFRAERDGEKALTYAILNPYDPQQAERDLSGVPCPYIGLNPFLEKNRDLFFGREKITREIVERLMEKRLLVIVGPSGSGKTSLLNAGIVPALREGKIIPESKSWHCYRPISPGSDPLTSLQQILQAERAADDPDMDLSPARFRENPEHLLQVVTAAGGAPAVISIDRLEDVFLLCKRDEDREAFVANLLTLVKSADTGHRVVLVIRSECVRHILSHPELTKLFGDAEERITPLAEEEIRRVIEEPAKRVGLIIKAGVVEQIIKEIYGDLAGLPLLQFTLLSLWEKMKQGAFTLAALKRLGNCRHSLARRAESFFDSLQTDENKEIAHRIMLRMVRLSEGLEVTGRPVSRGELHKAFKKSAQIDYVLAEMDRAHLVRISRDSAPEALEDVTFLDDQFELAHESLVTYWPRLEGWVKEERRALVIGQRLNEKVAEWMRLGRSSSGLLDEVQTREAEEWLASDAALSLGYNDMLPELVAESRKAIDAARREKELQHQTLIEKERQRADAEAKRADTEARAKRRSYYFLGALLVGIIVTVALGLAALNQRNQARSERERANSNRLAAQALLNADSNPDQALLLSVEAVSIYDQDNSEARKSLERLLASHSRLEKFLYGHPDQVRSLVLPSEKSLVSIDVRGQVISWDLAHPQMPKPSPLKVSISDERPKVRLSPDGKRLLLVTATESFGRHITIWDTETGQQVYEFKIDKQVTAYGFAPDSKTVAVAEAGTIHLRNCETKASRELEADTSVGYRVFTALTFSPDGKTLAASSHNESESETQNDIVQWDDVWKSNKGKSLANSNRIAEITHLAFGPDKKRLVSADEDGYIRIWNLDGVELGRGLWWGKNKITDLAFSSVLVGENLVFAWSDSGGGNYIGRIKAPAVAPSKGKPSAPDITSLNYVLKTESLAFSPDGKTLALSGPENENAITLWAIEAAPVETADIDSKVRLACGIANRNLSQDEWNQFMPGVAYNKRACGN